MTECLVREILRMKVYSAEHVQSMSSLYKTTLYMYITHYPLHSKTIEFFY
jgi:hypothetical protein